MAAAIGVLRLALTVLSFGANQFEKSEGPKVGFNFYIGSDGAKNPDDSSSKPLSNAGGNLPDIRIWEENADFIKIQTNDNKKCEDGSVVCTVEMKDVQVQPTYTLFTANKDAMCISYITVNFPGDTSKYATTIGGWARACSEKYEGRGGSWYYSDIYVQPKDEKDGGSFKTECAWIDADGDQETTGISVHWPEYDGNKGIPKDANLDYFCNHDAVLKFHTDKNPTKITYWNNKRDIFSGSPSVGLAKSPADTMIKRQKANEARAKRTTEKHVRSLVKSTSGDHTSEELCNAKTSAGPSFVSYTDRKFCHMETKTLYPLCEDVTDGEDAACFDDETNTIKAHGNVKREALPDLNFDKVTHWS